MQLRSSPITYLQGFFNFLNSIIKTVKYQKLVQLNFLESFFEVLKNMKYLQKSWQLNSVEVNKLIFLCTFYNSYYFLPEFHFLSTLYDSFFIYCAWLRLSFLFHFFWAIMEFEVYEGQITKIYHGLCYLMHQVLKRYRNIFFACE